MAPLTGSFRFFDLDSGDAASSGSDSTAGIGCVSASSRSA
jgi:hypothetical protein